MTMKADVATDVEFKDSASPGLVHVYLILDGQRFHAFRYFADELTFTKEELLGKTLAEARALHHARDRDYLTRGM